MTRPLTRALATVLLLAAAPAAAEDFPYDKFPRTTLAAVAEAMRPDTVEATATARRNRRPVFVLDVRTPRALVRATFTGEIRPIPAERMRLIANFFGTLGRGDAADVYRNEYRVTDAGRSWWLPMQHSLEPSIAEELKPGQATDLYLLQLGNVTTAGGSDLVLIVEEFDATLGAAN